MEVSIALSTWSLSAVRPLIFVVTLEHELVHVKRRSGASCVDRAEFWAGDPERSQGAVEPRFWYGSPNAHREVSLLYHNDVLR